MGIYNLKIKQGATFKFMFIYRNQETKEPINLTNYDVFMQIRRGFELTSELVIDLSIGNGITVTPEEGKIEVELTPSQTELLALNTVVDRCNPQREARLGYYDLKISQPSHADRLLEGEVFLSREVTKNE